MFKILKSAGNREGFALLAILIVMILITVLGTAALNTASDQQMAGRAVRESAKTFYAAQAGLHQIVADWPTARYDTLMQTTGDSLMLGPVSVENGSSYTAVLRRVDGYSDPMLYSVVVRGRSPGGSYGQKMLRTMLRMSVESTPEGVFFGADLDISGAPTITGSCADVHTNGDLSVPSDDVIIDGAVSASGSKQGDGVIHDSGGNPVDPEEGAAPQVIPYYDPLDYCGEADYTMRNGWVIPAASPGDSADAGNNEELGWVWDSGDNVYEYKDDTGTYSGTMCAYGGVKIGNSPGSSGSPMPLTILAQGHVEISGDPFIDADHSGGVLIIAEGDLKLSGSPGLSENFDGLVFGGAQCQISGNPQIRGTFICYGNSDPPGAKDVLSESSINGSPEITFDCAGGGGGISLEPFSGRAWSQF